MWHIDFDLVMRVSMLCRSSVFFFFKQKTAYEMRISDWSSDVCSSDLYETGKASSGLTKTTALRNWPYYTSKTATSGEMHGRSKQKSRSEERRVGKASVSTCRSRWST